VSADLAGHGSITLF